MELKGKVALITGSAQGIGKAIAMLFAKRGADIVISDMNSENAEKVSKEIEDIGRKSLVSITDVADFKAVEVMIKKTIDAFGRIDILVNNAGIVKDGLLLRMKEESWDQVLNVNLKGTFNCTKAAIRYMAKQKGGKVVNIASIAGEMGNIGQANYSASKAGVIGFTKTVAREFASRNINVNAVAPGFIDTEMTRALPENITEGLKVQIPIERLGTPEDVAEAVFFLVSEASSYITGQVLNVNGGLYM
ncbi:MAG: 3-oxoacyl-[acyl-carrier-protein] reductase [Thermodesulfobacteriota bacterium]|nr:3-oxoacyl-[acyl-carrier-protein] reductase [Thermodesulfobacteriota bacterium]